MMNNIVIRMLQEARIGSRALDGRIWAYSGTVGRKMEAQLAALEYLHHQTHNKNAIYYTDDEHLDEFWEDYAERNMVPHFTTALNEAFVLVPDDYLYNGCLSWSGEVYAAELSKKDGTANSVKTTAFSLPLAVCLAAFQASNKEAVNAT